MSDGYDLRHDYWACKKEECARRAEHCGENWCGAPRDHSLHTCTPQQVEKKSMTARECLEQLTQASAIAQQVAHNSEDPRTVRYAKGKHEGLQIALRLVREMEEK